MELPDKFEAQYEPEANSGCWLWTGRLNQQGYGTYWHPLTGALAHRFAYSELRGELVPGLELDHLCRTPSCVNPWHLEQVTHAENRKRSRRTVCRKGHPLSGDNLYEKQTEVALVRTCRICKREEFRVWAKINRPPGWKKRKHRT